MTKLVFKYDNYWENVLYQFEIYSISDFSQLDNVNQVYGLVLNSNNKILLVSSEQKKWILPGGSVEKGETPIDTLKREVYEESAIVVNDKTIKPFFFQKVYSLDGDKKKYLGTQARFICRIERQDKFVEDPDLGEIKHQLFVDLKELNQYLKWGKTTKFIQDEILKIAV